MVWSVSIVLSMKTKKIRKKETDMKRLITSILTVAMVFSIGTVSAFAAGHGHGHGRHHVETNADYAYCHFADEDGDGLCDACGMGIGQCGGGRYYVDANNDNICDNYASGTCPQGGSGYGPGCHGGCYNR
jgi:hypothetical protein